MASAAFELLRKPVDPRLALIDLRRAAPRVLLAGLDLREPALSFCKQLLCAHLVGLQTRLQSRQLGLARRQRNHGSLASLELGKPARHDLLALTDVLLPVGQLHLGRGDPFTPLVDLDQPRTHLRLHALELDELVAPGLDASLGVLDETRPQPKIFGCV